MEPAADGEGNTITVITTSEDRPENYHALRHLEIEHRHRNTLRILEGLGRFKLKHAETPEGREALSCMVELIDTLAALERIANAGRGGDLTQRLQDMASQWQRLCNGCVRIAVEGPAPIPMPERRQTLVVLIALEAVLNAIQHAFPAGRRGTIRIQAAHCGNTHAMLTVQDDGVGVAEDLPGSAPSHADGETTGTALLKSLSDALEGRLMRGNVEGGEGYRTAVIWPL